MTKLIDFKKNNDNIIYNTGALVAEYIAPNHVSSMTINNLDIKRDGGVYDIVIMEYTPTSSSQGHYIRINDLIDGYYGKHYYEWNNSKNIVCAEHGTTLGFCNGWSQDASLFFTTATLMYFNKDWIGFQANTNCNRIETSIQGVSVLQNCQILFKDVDNITSLTILGNDSQIGKGSVVRIYKRLGGGQ